MNFTTDSKTEITRPRQATGAIWLRRVRQWHLYLGTFFAPSIIFFALSGALQLFGLHEGHPGETYQPPVWVAKLGSIHKNQTLSERHGPPPGLAGEQRRPPEAAQAGVRQASDGRRRNENREESKSTFALKWFFLAMAIGLVFTTCLGIYMAFKYNRSRVVIWSLLLSGTVIPAALVGMTV